MHKIHTLSYLYNAFIAARVYPWLLYNFTLYTYHILFLSNIDHSFSYKLELIHITMSRHLENLFLFSLSTYTPLL